MGFSMPQSYLLPIGKIRKAHGIRGEVSAEIYADSPDLFEKGVFLQRNAEEPAFYQIESFRKHHGQTLLLFHGVSDRSTAENLRGCSLLLPEKHLPVPDEGEVYLYQLLGYTVIGPSAGGEDCVWGNISAISEPAGQELWTISLPEEEDILFPAVPELVIGFDAESRSVRIAPPSGLFELYRG